MFVPDFGAAISGHHVGVYLGQDGGIDGHTGVIRKFSRFAGAYPPHVVKRDS